ncbi:CatB-related O-acetyltransferase [uncultured Gammaproteobacteria bacterium]
MKFLQIYIDKYENKTNDIAVPAPYARINAGAKIFSTTLNGPLYLNRHTQLGPNVTAGKYLGMNADCFIARATIGAYCSIGARTSINPFNHPTSWLSTHEFQYHANSYNWVEEWNDFARLERTPDMFEATTIGNDVWMGHNVNVMPGVKVGDGAVIGAGSVVTRDVPPFAIVAGVPAVVKKYRFSAEIIERLLAVRWWDLDLGALSGLDFRDPPGCLSRLEDIRAALQADDGN